MQPLLVHKLASLLLLRFLGPNLAIQLWDLWFPHDRITIASSVHPNSPVLSEILPPGHHLLFHSLSLWNGTHIATWSQMMVVFLLCSILFVPLDNSFALFRHFVLHEFIPKGGIAWHTPWCWNLASRSSSQTWCTSSSSKPEKVLSSSSLSTLGFSPSAHHRSCRTWNGVRCQSTCRPYHDRRQS